MVVWSFFLFSCVLVFFFKGHPFSSWVLARVVLPLKADLSFPVLRADNVGTKPSLPWCEGGCGGLERNVAEHCGTPKGLLPGAEMLSGHMRECQGCGEEFSGRGGAKHLCSHCPGRQGRGCGGMPLGAGGQMAHWSPNPTRAFSNCL